MADNQNKRLVGESKTCKRCLQEKSVNDFPRMNQYIRLVCKECVSLPGKERRKQIAEAKKALKPIDNRTEKEKQAERHAAWMARNPGLAKERVNVWRENNRERHREYTKKWKGQFPELVAANNAIRKANKKQAIPNWLNVAHFVEMEGYYQWCSIFPGHHTDHIYPIQSQFVVGFHSPFNLQILTAEENLKKYNKLPDPATIAPYIERPTLVIDADGFASLKFEE